jgi:hypothetical protein
MTAAQMTHILATPKFDRYDGEQLSKEVPMPLLDHFRPPLSTRFPRCESFHSFWAVGIAEYLNRLMPRRYVAAVHTHLGSQVEADVAEFERPVVPEDEPRNGAGGVAVETWAPPVATMVIPAIFPDDLEVQVLDEVEDGRVVAVVELVSPRNKDRAESRRAFGAKCAAYLQRGIGVVTVDTVTSRQFNLHNDFVQVMALEERFALPAEVLLSAIAYRPARREATNEIDIWAVPLTVGGTLPVLPLAIKGSRAVPLDLEATYTNARQRSRL